MTVVTVVGPIADKVGAAVTIEHGRPKYHSTPSLQYRRAQVRAPVHFSHQGAEIGQVEHLELLEDKQLVAVATVTIDDDTDLSGDWYWSPTVRYSDDRGAIDLLECSLTRTPATVGLRPVVVLDGDLRHGFVRDRWQRQTFSSRVRAMYERAADSAQHGGPIMIRTSDELAAERRSSTEDTPTPRPRLAGGHEMRRPAGRMQYGPPGRVLSVR